MTKPKPLKGRTWNPYSIPTVIDPGGVRCVKVYIPDSLQWLQILAACLDTMNHWKNYELLGDTTAGQCAALMREIGYRYQTLATCDDCADSIGTILEAPLSTQIRISPDDSCIIQMWCIDHWENWYDPRQCIASGSAQAGPQEPPALDSTDDFFVNVNGRDQWLLPFPVSGGDIITVTEAKGGWNDGTLTWACPSGGVYGLGICGAPLAPSGSDPIPTLPHMRLIGQVGTSGGYFDAYGGPYTVPNSFTDEQVTFQANDATLSDNQGSITFKVTVTHKLPASWISIFDLTVSSYAGILSIPYGTFVAGSGIEGVNAGGTQLHTVVIDGVIPARTLTRMAFVYNSGGGSGGSESVQFSTNTGLYGTPGTPLSGTNRVYTQSVNRDSVTGVELAIGSGTTDVQVIVKSWTVEGLGTKPAGWP